MIASSTHLFETKIKVLKTQCLITARPPSLFFKRVGRWIGLLSAVLSLDCLLMAQETKEAESEEVCSVPKEFKKSRPNPKGAPIEVTIGSLFFDIKAINDREQTFTVDVFYTIRWDDPRLSEKSLGRSLEYCDISLDQIWHPDLIDVNMLKGDKRSPDTVDIDAEGNVTYRERWRNTEFYSDLNFKNFPFDKQVLHLTLIEYESSPNEISFSIDYGYTELRERSSIEGWDIALLNPEITSEHLSTSKHHLNRIDFRLSAKRQLGHYLWKMIVPVGFIVLMAWCVFWINPSQIGPQIGLATGTVFTLFAYRGSLGFIVPPIAYFTRMDKYVFLSTLLVFLALGGSVVTSTLAFENKTHLAQELDRYFRIIYLILFAGIIGYSFFL